MNEKIVEQAWRLFDMWRMGKEGTEEYSRVQNGLFELLKKSDPDWRSRLDPPALSIHVTDSMGAADKVGG